MTMTKMEIITSYIAAVLTVSMLVQIVQAVAR